MLKHKSNEKKVVVNFEHAFETTTKVVKDTTKNKPKINITFGLVHKTRWNNCYVAFQYGDDDYHNRAIGIF